MAKSSPIPSAHGSRSRVRRLTEAVLELEDIIDGYRPGTIVSVLQIGAFVIRFISLNDAKPVARGCAATLGIPPAHGLSISRTTKKLLEVSWQDSTKPLVKVFTPGPWEKELLRLLGAAR